MILILFPASFKAQYISVNGFSLALGAHIEIGYPINKIGLSLNTGYSYKFAAIHSGAIISYHFSDLGKRNYFTQLRMNLGAQLFAGKNLQNPQLPLQHYARLSSQNMGIGYQYLWYFDNSNSTQKSGAWSLFIEKTTLYFENDIFAGQGRDRFRTGQLIVDYREKNIHFYSGLTMWTGESRGGIILTDSIKNMEYRDLRSTVHGKTSHGILFIGAGYTFSPIHTANALIGIDSDKIRDAVQNKIFHSHGFIKSKKVNTTPCYPMLDSDGNFTFDKSKIRKNRLFFSLNLNQTN